MKTIQLDSFEDFRNVTAGYMIQIDDYQLNQFKKYYEVLSGWNKKINLISRKEQNILEKHFLDSILFLPEIVGLINQTPTVCDIGSGGGFPAIPLAIMKPDWHFTLCESIKKKANFLNHLVKELNLKNAEVMNVRVGARHGTPLQTKFDFITARAVVKLDILIKYALPLLKKDGYLLAYKAKDIDDEIKNITLPLQIFSKEVNGVTRKLVVLSHPGIL